MRKRVEDTLQGSQAPDACPSFWLYNESEQLPMFQNQPQQQDPKEKVVWKVGEMLIHGCQLSCGMEPNPTCLFLVCADHAPRPRLDIIQKDPPGIHVPLTIHQTGTRFGNSATDSLRKLDHLAASLQGPQTCIRYNVKKRRGHDRTNCNYIYIYLAAVSWKSGKVEEAALPPSHPLVQPGSSRPTSNSLRR